MPLPVSMTFQSLSRDSVCLDYVREGGEDDSDDVSIPESGFCLFGLKSSPPCPPGLFLFQSLSRDSVCLDPFSIKLPNLM